MAGLKPPMSSPETGPTGPQREISWRSPEIFGELVLLAVVFGLAVVFLSEIRDWPKPARWLPLIAIGSSAPFWVMRLFIVLGRKKALEAGAIMDLGFRLGENPDAERRRSILFVLSVGALFIGVWALGFHIGLPLWVMLYLWVYSKTPSLIVVLIGAAFEGFLLGILDYIVNVEWFEPLFFRLISVEYPFNTWPISSNI